MRRPFIAGNWKMNMTPSEGAKFAKELVENLKDCSARVMIAPPFITIPAVKQVIDGSNILLGAQNIADHESGAYTGEISPAMLKDAGVQVVIIGHSERRALYCESNELINAKVKLALAHGFEVILCVGETLEERQAGSVKDVVGEQLTKGLSGVILEDMARVVIAYEPVWAIGTGMTATPEDADEVHTFIRSSIESMYSASCAEAVIIQYGGSVKPGNVASLMQKEHIDGALVGGASLTADAFVPIVKF